MRELDRNQHSVYSLYYHLIMVTNDLFSDGETYSSSVQEYLRCLAEINRQAAILADHVIEVVYSIPVALKGELP